MSFPVVDGLRTMEFGSPGQMRDWLNDLVLSGRKVGTFGLVDEYVEEDEPVEEVGERLCVVDDDLQPGCRGGGPRRPPRACRGGHLGDGGVRG